MDATVSFVRMADGTAEDYELLFRAEASHEKGQVDRILSLLRAQQSEGIGGYKISRYQHALQTATFALRDGAEEEMVVAALLHDIGDDFAMHNHSAFAAAVLRPYVSERTHWIVLQHGLFQGKYYFQHLGLDPDARERHRGHPHFQACVDFCDRWDQEAFNPDAEILPLEAFEPMVRRVFARQPFACERLAG